MLSFTTAAWISGNYVLDAGQEGYEKDTGRRKVGDGVTPWNSLPYAIQAGNLIKLVQYAPTPKTVYTTNSASMVAVDSTNLTVNFSAPPTGVVMVRLIALVVNQTPGNTVVWGLLNHGTTQLASTTEGATDLGQTTVSLDFKVSGLTPGLTYFWDWGWFVTTGTGEIDAGQPTGATPVAAPATIEVWAAM